MEFKREWLDEETGEYVLEYEASVEEKEKLDEYCKKHNTTPSEIIEKFMQKCIDNPKEFQEWIKKVRDDKLPKGVPGKPACKEGELVGFYLIPYGEKDEQFFKGTVEIIDKYGTFEQNEEPSYDILVENFNEKGPTLVKHVRESEIYKIST